MQFDPTRASTGRIEPRLLADIGATFAHFCVETSSGVFEHVAVLPCDDYPGFSAVVRAYLDSLPTPRPRRAAVAIANPIQGDQVRMTNRDWSFSIRAVCSELGLTTLLVVNDFTALAMALPRLSATQRRQVGEGAPQTDGVIGLIGPGTGLGVSGLVPLKDRWVTLASEGGHANFAPADERELRLLQFAWTRHPRVSAERLLSVHGIELIHQALAFDPGSSAPSLPASEIVLRARRGQDALCRDTIDCFCGMLGSMAGDLALTLGATGGIFVGGGIVPHLGELLDRSPFRARFEAKGRFSGYVARIPTYVVTADNPTFQGVSSLLDENAPDGEASTPMLQRVRAASDELSPAERRVAEFVLANPRRTLNDPIGAIAREAGVSEPTVIRFCRSLGFQGLSDFKLKLGSGLTGTLPVQRSQVRRQDGIGDLCAKVLDNTISTIVQFRESLNVEAVDRAIELLRGARRVEFYALGNSAVVALDAQHKLFRFHMPSVVYSDPAWVAVAAGLLGPGDVAMFISNSGRVPELARAAAVAVEHGASVIAITAGQSPLARRATVCIPVDHDEDASSFVAMVSRILQLLAMDMLAVGLAVRRTGGDSITTPGVDSPEGLLQPAPGVLISHIA